MKGKDSSNYSADDLGCILGTKSDKLKNKSEPSSPQVEPEEEDDVKDILNGFPNIRSKDASSGSCL